MFIFITKEVHIYTLASKKILVVLNVISKFG
jgi:hypothetical protein